MFSDEYLDYWGEIFAACRLAEGGIVFEQFLQDPWRDLCALGLQSAPVSLALGFRPLLPRQRAAAQRLWRRWEEEDREMSKSGRPGVATRRIVPGASAPLSPVRGLLPSAFPWRSKAP